MYNKSMKDPEVRNTIREMYHQQGMSGAAIGTVLGIPARTILDYIAGNTWNGEGRLQYNPEDVSFKEESEIDIDSRTISEYPVKTFKEILKETPAVLGEIHWKSKESRPQKILVIADTQCKPSEDLSYMSWIGKYINDKKPDIIVHIGDHYDMPSLSSYDKGKKSFEGRRVKADIDAGNLGMELLVNEFKSEDYNPRMVFCTGNHDQRLDRLANDMPELDGFIGTGLLPLKEMGWEVYDFLEPVEICGIFFVHYLANPFTGKPYSGTAMNQLKTIGKSFVVGHKQCLDIAIRPVIDGSQQIGIINGAAYPFDEDYKGHQGNNHFRGITMLHEARNGFALPMFVSMDYLNERYGK